METYVLYALGAVAALVLWRSALIRMRLSRAKHPSLAGHGRLARRVAKLVPYYSYGADRFFRADASPAEVERRRRLGFERLRALFEQRSPRSVALSEELERSVSDVSFINSYRIPFQFREHVRRHLKLGCVVEESSGCQIKDTDDNWAYDLTGSYGVNLFGYDFYKECIDSGIRRVHQLGPVLGAYHPLVVENVERLREISGLDEVSFHMSGTEAVMQAVRLARFHTNKTHLVQFCGAYHGWWDGVQPGLGNPRVVTDVYTLRDMSPRSLKVLRTRSDIACVLVNPLQALHPNANAPGDATLIDSSRTARFDRDGYRDWLRRLREICTERSIVLIFDEVFVGFRLARGGAQEYFGVRADIVTYGKTLGGGLPVGVVCGKRRYMKRFHDDRPTDVAFARGTFNSHPYVIAAMNEFLRRIDEPELSASYATIDRVWNDRAAALNRRLEEKALPVRVVNLVSVWTITYETPSRYNWMFQYYLRAEGLAVSWVGSGRLIPSHNYSDEDYAAVVDRFVRAAEAMHADGWWWTTPSVTNAAIRKQVLLEMLAARLRGHRAVVSPPSPSPSPSRPSAPS